ncbi:hypothetical protein GCM10019016_085330 [Streptomyces prasinosporus]|uniref:Uncharacterized protein n=1 Tax=Streptomyces prasinosporus TaxID=68256 RepID=A0ABP6U184_9ACTN
MRQWAVSRSSRPGPSGSGGQQGALPQGVVGVLHRQRGPLGGPAGAAGRVGGAQVVREGAQRPAVGRAVVQDEQQGAVGSGAQQPGGEGAFRGQVEAVPQGGGDVGGGLRGGAVHQAQPRAQPAGRQDALVRHAVVLGEHRPQGLVAVGQVAEGRAQRLGVEAGGRRDEEGDVVGRRSVVEPVEEPHAFLGEGQRRALRAYDVAQGGAREGGAGPLGEPCGEGGRCRRLEQDRDGDLGAGLVPQAGQQAGGEQGVAAEVEEVHVGADGVARQPQHVLEQPAHQGLLGGGGPGAGRGGGEVRGGQGRGVQLAVGGQRQRVDGDAGGRDHVLGQPGRGVGAQVGGVHGVAAGGDGVGDEPPDAVVGAADHHGGPGDARVGGEDGLDLARFDAEAADLHLGVDPAEVFERAVRAAPGQVARAVHPGAGRAVGVVQEAFGGQFGPVQVSGGHARAGDVHLAGRAGRHRASVGVEQVHAQVGERAADDAGAARVVQVGAGEAVVGDVHGGLGDAVHVHQHRPVQAVPVRPGAQALRAQGLAAEHHVAQRARPAVPFEIGVDQLLEGGGRLVEDGDALPVQQLQEVPGRAADGVRDDDDPAAVQQGAPDLPDREVEGVGVEQRPDVVGAEVEVLRGGGEEPDDVRVRHRNALGAAGGTRGVDDVGGVGRARRPVPVGVGQVGRGPAGEAGGRLGVVQHDDGTRVRDGRAGVGVLGDERDGCRVLDDQPQPLRRVAGVQGEVGGARLEHGQQGGQQPRAALQGQGHHPARAGAVFGQQPGQAVGLRVELGVREVFVAAGDGGPPGCGRGPPLEQLREGVLDRVGAHGRVAGVLARQQDVQVPQRRRRLGLGQPAQHGQEPLAVQGEFVLLVQGGVGVEGQPQAAGPGPGPYRYLQVVDCSAGQVVPGGGVSVEDR